MSNKGTNCNGGTVLGAMPVEILRHVAVLDLEENTRAIAGIIEAVKLHDSILRDIQIFHRLN